MHRTIKYVTLEGYARKIPKFRKVSPPGSTMQCELLTDEIKQLLRRVLALMPDPQTNRRCLLKFTGRNIMVDLESQKPFLQSVKWTKYTNQLAQKNYETLRQIFIDTIFGGTTKDVPPDFSALLDLMASSGDVASYTIQHHCSLVWAIDKELFTRIHDNLHNVLRQQKPQDYKDVMNNLLFPPNWDIEIQQNTYLHQCYKGSTYQPQGRNPGRQVLRYTRNSYTHGLEHSMNKQTLQQMYDQSQLGEMIETVLPLLLHSLQLELDKRGLLRNIRLASLFQ